MSPAGEFAYDHDDDVLAAIQFGIPSRKQPGAGEALAAADLVGIGYGFRNTVTLLGEQIGVPLGYMSLSLCAQLYLAMQIRAPKACHFEYPEAGAIWSLPVLGATERGPPLKRRRRSGRPRGASANRRRP